MRKLLVVIGMGLFLMAMCVMPSMYGENPCPKMKVNDGSKGLCEIDAGYDVSGIGADGEPKSKPNVTSVSCLRYSKADCGTKKSMTRIFPDRSKQMPSDFDDEVYLDSPPVGPPNVAKCYSYVECMYEPNLPGCITLSTGSATQINYDEKPCKVEDPAGGPQ